ncbi:hypothetical protein BLA29_005960 [Euroglyphus maynei]|uniref:Uncharacterized protein n=1 Tax=Euroglyphus maynei TaxID=6958 RepID=A0A1Y3BDT8_EURMA|nr:hypothetical protein BLA29_005960 [Euroglyphus maynei]
MKVPLEMRKYNWMAVPPPPPIPTATNNIKNDPINEQNHKRSTTHSDRTIIPILAPTTSLSYQLANANSINHNGIISVPASNEILPKTAIIVNTGSFGNNIVNQQLPNDSILSKQQSTVVNNLNVTAPASFNPSHTLAPLVAAAMAATPVTIKQEMTNETATSEPITTTNTNNGNNAQSSQMNVTVTTNATTVLRHLARQQYVQIQYPQQIQLQQPPDSRPNQTNSINLTTLASVAALAGNNRNSTSATSSPQFCYNSSSFQPSTII